MDVDHSFDNDLGVDLDGIPTSFSLDITGIPKIQIGLDPITIEPLDVSVRLKEFPSIRAHVPANFSIGLSMLGYELLCVRLCGEAQVITEPYEPNPCEYCDERKRVQPPGTVDHLPQPAEVPK